MPGQLAPAGLTQKLGQPGRQNNWADANRADAKMSGRSNNSKNWCNSSAFDAESASDLCVTP